MLIGDRGILSEALKHRNFQGRPKAAVFKIRGVAGGQYVGITANEGKSWGEIRGFAVRGLKELGLGHGTMEETVVEAAWDVAEYFR